MVDKLRLAVIMVFDSCMDLELRPPWLLLISHLRWMVSAKSVKFISLSKLCEDGIVQKTLLGGISVQI